MLTERFHSLRKELLKEAFTKSKIIETWRKTVKNQLRNFDIKDMYDNYDFNFNIEERAERIRYDILNGYYTVSLPIHYKIEKKYGICRHIVQPLPIDALVLQLITDILSVDIIPQKPVHNVYYSRDKDNVKGVNNINIDEYGYNWRELWKQMQEKIFQFNKEKKLLVVTDLVNYYDCIDINILRNRINSMIQGKEVLIDILFKIIEGISWKPDYLPYSKRGLPTTNIEGIRLLAHSFLFELDNITGRKSENCFTRWMDDITIGVDTYEDGVNLLSVLSDVLNSQGLAFNLSKTQIYDAKESEYNFQIQQNTYLNSLDFDISNKKEAVKELKLKFIRHMKDQKPKYWDKVTKRYITAFAKNDSKYLYKNFTKYYKNHPSLRLHLLYYIKKLGYNQKASNIIIELLDSIHLYDDISLFNITQLVTDWMIFPTDKNDIYLKQYLKLLLKKTNLRKKPFDFYCILWFMGKYSHPLDISKFIKDNEYMWKSYPFLTRSVIAAISRLLVTGNKDIYSVLNKQLANSNYQISALANQVLKFSDYRINDYNFNSKKLNSYLFPKKKPIIYPLPKFMVLSNILTSNEIREDKTIQKKVLETINDPYYKYWLKTYYSIDKE